MSEVLLYALISINFVSFSIGLVKPIVETPDNMGPEEGFYFLLSEAILPITVYKFMINNYNMVGSIFVAVLSIVVWPGVLIGVLLDAVFFGGWFLFEFLFRKR